MRTTTLTTAIGSAALLILLAACGSDDGPQSAADPAGPGDTSSSAPSSAPAAGPPSSAPAAPGEVRSRLITVMDTGDGPELCLGAIAESYPPQCGGPAVTDWRWKAQAPNFEQQGDIRWGTFVVTGTWDGTTFGVTDAIPGALYDPAPEQPVTLPTPSRDLSPAELEALATELGDGLPGAQGAYPDQEGHVLVDVTYDDGSIQDYVDATYGEGVVVVTGALIDA